jgi:hypothetical protein
MTSQWVNLALAAIALLQLLVTEIVSGKTHKFSDRYFSHVIAEGQPEELGLPTEPKRRQRLLNEVHAVGNLATEASAVLSAQVAAIIGYTLVAVISLQRNSTLAFSIAIVCAIVLVLFSVSLIVHTVGGDLRRYPRGVPREDAGFRQRLKHLETLTPYKAVVIVTAGTVGIAGAFL